MARRVINLDNIQGNVLGGFNKDFQTFLFLRFKRAKNGRDWIGEIAEDISSSSEVLRFNSQFKALRAEDIRRPETLITATWVNLGLSFRGLKALGIESTDLKKFPRAFRDGMAARKVRTGDLGDSDPSRWTVPFGAGQLHAILLVAADRETDLNDRVQEITDTHAFRSAVEVLPPLVQGRVRPDQPGHEHFGFRDGVSQPGIRGVTPPDDPIANPNQGHPGQDLLWPGEFVIGYPTQIPKAKKGFHGPNPDPGRISKSGPAWTADGSYMVFRRLGQDVPGFRHNVTSISQLSGLSEDLVGAKLVGRYQSGYPVEPTTFQPKPFVPAPTDPGVANPTLAESNTLNNDFEFGGDPIGAICPLAAHIRKVYPRDERTLSNAHDSESETQTHRLLRRGIPYGSSFGAQQGGGTSDPRGLLFLAYQKDIETQFEFVQRNWVNDPGSPPFPHGLEPGQDPIIAQSPRGPFQLDPTQAPMSIQHFVVTTGGEYFLAPSLDALRKIGTRKI